MPIGMLLAGKGNTATNVKYQSKSECTSSLHKGIIPSLPHSKLNKIGVSQFLHTHIAERDICGVPIICGRDADFSPAVAAINLVIDILLIDI